MLLRTALFAMLAAGLALAQKDWDEPFPPHKIADNVYYVGSKGLSTYLITSSQGNIVINASFDRTVPLIRSSIEKLGFPMTSVKIILSSHAHDDHVAGTALLKELTGAQVMMMAGDDQTLAKGGAGQYLYKGTWKPVKVSRVLKDGDKVTLGDVTLVAHLTPGHTRGCTTWTMKATDRGKTYDVVIVGSPNANSGYQLVDNKDYPEIAKDFERTFEVLKSLHCDIFLGAHGEYYGMVEKYARLQKDPKTNPFIDPDGYRAYVAEREQAVLKTLNQQKTK